MRISYGSGNSAERNIGNGPRDLRPGTTVAQVLETFRAQLGYGANVEAHLDCVPQNANLVVTNEMQLVVNDRASTKAS